MGDPHPAGDDDRDRDRPAASPDRRLTDGSADDAPVTAADGRLGALARHYLAQRRRRAAIAADLFADPAWDMLLDLFAARAEGIAVSVSSACIASNVPTSTALFWVRKLEVAGLVVRVPDRIDRRRTFLVLSDPARRSIRDWLAAFAGPAGAREQPDIAAPRYVGRLQGSVAI